METPPPPASPHNQIHMSMYLMRVTKLGPHPASNTYVYVFDEGIPEKKYIYIFFNFQHIY